MTVANPSLDKLECFDPSLMSMPFNRRVTLRYPCGLATTTKLRMGHNDGFQRVPGHNISQGGMALVLEECPEVGTLVNVRMKNRLLNFTYDLSARIVHVAVIDKRQWLVGLAFARQLTLAELASLL